MTWDCMRIRFLVMYSVLTTNFLALNGSPIPTNLEVLPYKRSSDKCPEIKDQKTFSINNCTYQWPEVSCNMAVKTAFQTTKDNKAYFSFLLKFRVPGSDPGNYTKSTECTDGNEVLINGSRSTRQWLALSRVDILLDKSQQSDNKSVLVFLASLPYVLFSSSMIEVRLEASFNSSQPTASVTLDESCLTRKGPPCTTSLEITAEMNILGDGKFDISSEDFWTPLRNLIRNRLNGRIRLLHLVQGSSKLDIISEILPHLHGFGIEDLMLVGAHWTHLQRKHLRNIPDLKALNLSGNGITTIENNVFESTPNIERLDLSKNRIEYLPDSISSLRKLEVLDLSRNPQLHVENISSKLKSVINLSWLNLSKVPLKSLETLRYFAQYKNDTEHNKIPFQLLGINLSGCDITISEDDVTFFDLMPSLMHIDLSRNHLSTLPPNIFRSQKNLKSLNLASNVLINGFRLETAEIQGLNLLDLSNNKLSNLESIYISGTVEEINLSENAVSEWSKNDVFLKAGGYNRSWVKRLNLTYNAITTISEYMSNSLLFLDSVDLGQNPLNCDTCEIQPLQRWLRQQKNTKIFNLGTTDNLICGGSRSKRREIINVSLNSTWCLSVAAEDKFDPVLVTGLPLTVVMALILLTAIAMYGYRFEIAYVRHLINIRRQRHLRENEPIGQYHYDAFVSYSVADRDWVIKELQPQLEEGPEKYHLCLHERDFVLGSIIANNIVDCMRNSRITLVILSPHFVRSQWCRWELEVANHKLFEDDREFLVLVELERLDRRELPQHLSYLLDTRTYLEWPEGPGHHPGAWRRLKYALGESLYQKRARRQANQDDSKLARSCD